MTRFSTSSHSQQHARTTAAIPHARADADAVDMPDATTARAGRTTPEPTALFFRVPCPTLGQEVCVAAWAFAPHHVSDFLPSMWMLCIPGGTYRGLAHFDRQVPGYAPFAYSFARHMTEEGIGVLVIDNLGTGASPAPAGISGEHITCARLSDAYQYVVAQARARLRKGTLIPGPGLAPVADPFVVGVGHSMGGLYLVETQGRYHSCDAIAILGYSPGKAGDALTIPGIEDTSAFVQQAFQQMSAEGSLTLDRRVLHPFFFSPQVPAALIEADDADATVVPAGVVASLQPGSAAPTAAQIRAPIYLGFTEIDVVSSPHAEPAAYVSSTSITLSVQSGRGARHCGNFEPGRFDLWRDMVSWCRTKAMQSKGSRAAFSHFWHVPADLLHESGQEQDALVAAPAPDDGVESPILMTPTMPAMTALSASDDWTTG